MAFIPLIAAAGVGLLSGSTLTYFFSGPVTAQPPVPDLVKKEDVKKLCEEIKKGVELEHVETKVDDKEPARELLFKEVLGGKKLKSIGNPKPVNIINDSFQKFLTSIKFGKGTLKKINVPVKTPAEKEADKILMDAKSKLKSTKNQ